MKQKILDAACGSKMFWYDRNNESANAVAYGKTIPNYGKD